MKLKPDDLEDPARYRLILTLNYGEIVTFVLEYLRKKSSLMFFFWTFCLLTFGIAAGIRVEIAGLYEHRSIFLHSMLGFILFPIAIIPVHEALHVIPYVLSGARNIRAGADLKQFIVYVTAHRYVATAGQFRLVALVPFAIISAASVFLLLWLPGLWKWSISSFLFAHSTMCAGDFALLNFYHLQSDKKIYTWDDADRREAYFYEEI